MTVEKLIHRIERFLYFDKMHRGTSATDPEYELLLRDCMAQLKHLDA